MQPSPLIIIPARFAATRLPGKPLADIAGKPMILHVWERAIAAGAGRVVVATDTVSILEVIEKAGGQAVLTRPDHPSGSDRIHEAMQIVDPVGSHNIIINLQGDMPTLDSGLIHAVLAPLSNPGVDIATLVAEITDAHERTDPAVVKAVIALREEETGTALYFTRAQAPYGQGPLYHHIGIYAYRREALERFVSLPPSPLELREKLEQLRALEAGMRLDIRVVNTVPLGVDTPETLEKARRYYATPL